MKPDLKNNSLCIVTPIWKKRFTKYEHKNLSISLFYNKSFVHYFVCPEDMDITYYQNYFPDSNYMRFSLNYFKSIKSYNLLLQSEFFYRTFSSYIYMLILQPDALLVKPINVLLSTDFDYVGAPWDKGIRLPRYLFSIRPLSAILKKIGFNYLCFVGNGGLSLRKVDTFIRICKKSKSVNWLNEDLYFSLLGMKKVIKIPPKDIAEKLFFEKSSEKISQLPDVIGYHAIEKYYPTLYLELLNKIHL